MGPAFRLGCLSVVEGGGTNFAGERVHPEHIRHFLRTVEKIHGGPRVVIEEDTDAIGVVAPRTDRFRRKPLFVDRSSERIRSLRIN